MRRHPLTYLFAWPHPCELQFVVSLIAIFVSFGAWNCIAAQQYTAPRDKPIAARQTAFRVRANFNTALNANDGWAGALNEHVSVRVDQPFRIRFELEGRTNVNSEQKFGLQCRCNGGEWSNVEAEDFPVPEEASPQVSIVSTAAYKHGWATTNLLQKSTTAFREGAGIALASTTPSWSVNNAHGEWEWPLVIRRFADRAATADHGDKFEFRIIGENGELLDYVIHPVITTAVPSRHLGGTFVETPGRVGPWQASNGDLYFIMEPAETDNLLMIVKSSDLGATWQEVDGTNRPEADDLEGVASVQWGNTIHLLHQTSDEVWHHSFRMSDHPTQPDSWNVRDELVATPAEPPVQVASIVVRTDGSVVGFYGAPEKVHFKIRSRDGSWGEESVLDAGIAPKLSGPQAVLGDGDVVHIAYTADDGTAWYRTLRPNGTLTPCIQVASGLGTTEHDVGSILPLVFIPETNTVVVIYRLADGRLWERRIIADRPPTASVQVTDRYPRLADRG